MAGRCNLPADGHRSLAQCISHIQLTCSELCHRSLAGCSVIDASVALAWCFKDEASDCADDVLVALGEHTVLVPVLWPIEITNALLAGQNRRSS